VFSFGLGTRNNPCSFLSGSISANSQLSVAKRHKENYNYFNTKPKAAYGLQQHFQMKMNAKLRPLTEERNLRSDYLKVNNYVRVFKHQNLSELT
jgi:hypothetical protein